MLDDAVRKVSSVEPPWDELRDRRVLASILAPRRPSKTPLLVAALVVVLAVGIVALLRGTRTPPVASPAAAPSELPEPVESRLTLPDGSVAIAAPGADVHVAEESTGILRLVQSAGTVRYTVRPLAGRRFVVEAGGISVEVVGTDFAVTVEHEGARVRVERGIVRVDDGDRRVDLRAGEELLVAPAQPPSVPERRPQRRPQTSPTPATPPFADLVERADDARAEGRLEDAATLLRTAVGTYPSEPGLATALFTLGRVERTLGRPAQAADAYGRCRAATSGSLAEDALAEEAEALADAGRFDEARGVALEYLERYPRGTHRARITPLAE